MIKFISLLFLIISTIRLTAQEYNLYAAPGPGGNSIQLKWLAKNPIKNKGFTIYRKTGATNWEKINGSPIVASPVITEAELSTSKNPFPNDSIYTSYIKIKNYKTTNDFDKQNLDFGLYFSAATNNLAAFHVGIFYEDTKVQQGVVYTYKVAVDEGKDLATSDEVLVNTKMAAPTNFQAKAGDKEVSLKWEYNKNILFYRVYNKQTANSIGVLVPDGEVIVTFETDDKGNSKLPDDFFVHAGLSNGVIYYYQITAVDFLGNESPLSNTINAIPHDLTPPAPVKGFKVVKDGKNVKLSWDVLTDTDLKGYNIYRSKTTDNNFEKITTAILNGSESKFTDKQVIEGGTIYYYVEASDSSGNKSYSAKIGVFFPDVTPPQVPSGLTVRGDTGLILLNWKKNTENDIMGYRVYRALENHPDNFNLLMINPISENNYTDSQPPQSRNRFTYRIAAVDKAYNESPFATIEAQMPDIVPPSPPLITGLEYKEGGVTVKWESQPELDLKGFIVLRKQESDSQFLKINKSPIPAERKWFTDNTVKIGQSYTYALQALDSANLVSGYSVYRSISLAMVADSSAADGISQLIAKYDSVKQVVTISFSYKKNTDALLGFLILRSLAEGDYFPISSPQKNTRLIDTGIQPGETYYYKIAVVTGEGEIIEGMESVRIEVR